jgi:hypothetical protein
MFIIKPNYTVSLEEKEDSLKKYLIITMETDNNTGNEIFGEYAGSKIWKIGSTKTKAGVTI